MIKITWEEVLEKKEVTISPELSSTKLDDYLNRQFKDLPINPKDEISTLELRLQLTNSNIERYIDRQMGGKKKEVYIQGMKFVLTKLRKREYSLKRI